MTHTQLYTDTNSVEKQETGLIEDVALEGHTATDIDGRPLIELDEAAEARLRWKLDLRLVPMVALLYLFCFIDRANIGNARLAGLERDLKLVHYDYNILLTSFYVAYVAFELPANLVCKLVGPGRFIPVLSFLFGLFSFVMAFVKTFGQGVAVRFLLGLAEAGVFPGMAYYMSRFYRKDELGFRLALYIVCAPLAGAFGGLIASGLLKLEGFGMIRSWRMIFFVEGLITMGIAVLSWFVLPNSPETAEWLTPQEKALCAVRIKSENVGSLEVIDGLHRKVIWQAMLNPTTLVVSLIFLLDNITVQGMGFFLPTIIKTIYPTKTTVALQLQTVPPYIVGAFFALLVPFLSWKTRRRAVYLVLSAPFMILGYALFIGTSNPQARYAATFLIATGAFSFGALCNAWAAINTTSDTARAATIGTVVFAGNLGGLVATWAFLPNFAPRQLPGNAMNLAGGVGILLLSAGLWAYQVRQNRRKEQGLDDHLLEGKTAAEAAMLGQRHPGFRFHT